MYSGISNCTGMMRWCAVQSHFLADVRRIKQSHDTLTAITNQKIESLYEMMGFD